MNPRYWLLLLALAIATSADAQAVGNDSTTVRIGYSKGNAITLAGAIDQLTEARMNKGLITSSLDALSGQAAGVQVTPIGNQEAMVSAVRVRGITSLTGKNDPLVIIDGVTADISILSTIYPADIESFTILKDASETAQYGSRGAAGVIEVATKKGKSQPFHISYDGSIGFESVYKRMEMLDANAGTVRIFPTDHRWELYPAAIGDLFTLFTENHIPVYLSVKAMGWDAIYRTMYMFPDLYVIICDCGLWGPDRRIRPLLVNYKHTYFETSEYWAAGSIADTVHAIGPERLLYGSGAPHYVRGSMMLAIKHADISDEAKELIAHGNLERLLQH